MINQLINNLLPRLPQTNPMAQNLMEMMKNNDSKGIEQMAKNILATNNMTFDDAQRQIIKSAFNK